MQTIRILALVLALVGISRAALPTIDTQPASSTNCPGTIATFTVAASSDSSTNYQWYFNETNVIVDATNTAHVIASVSALDAGTYSVVVTNNDGAVTSILAVLVVNDPTTASALANATVCPGANASFSTTAGGTGPFTYVWRKDGGAPLAELTGTLSLTGVTAVDAGVYSVEVTGACNSVTNSATLTVNALVAANGPVSTNACVGTATTFSTVASGTGPFAYQWSKTGTGDILDATNANYTIASVVGGDAGEYCVRVTGACNSVTNCATLTVNPAPTVTVNGAATVCPGTQVVLDVVTDATNPTYLWSPGGATTASITNAPGVTTVYSVVVTDGVTGCTNAGSATITVNTLTGISSAIGNNTNCPTTSRTFTATATGTGPFSYVWRRNGTLVQGPDGNSSYNIASVTAGDAGTYSVEVTGLCNSATNSGTLVVVGAPTIATQPRSATAPMGNGFVFSVAASTINNVLAPLSYQWRTNGVDVTGATASSLAISNLTLVQSGMLIDVAVTTCGGTTLSSAATLTVSPVSGISFDFNTPGQFTNAPYNLFGNEWQNNAIVNAQPFGPIVPHESPTGGVGVATGSGALDLIFNNGTDQSSTYLPSTFDFSLHGKTITMSIMTKIKVPTAAQRAIQIALINTNVIGNTMQGINANNGLGFISLIFQSSQPLPSVTPSYQLRTQVKPINGTATAEVTPVNSPTNTLNTNTWYKLVAKFTNIKGTTPNAFTIEASVQDMGTNGQVPGIITHGYSGTQTNADLVNHPRLLFSLRGFENGGQNYWDDIYVTTVSGPIAFVQGIGSPTVAQGKTATFRALVDGDGPYTYQWFKNGTPIAGAGNIKYQTPQLTLADNGAEFSVTVTSTNNSVSSTGLVSVVADTLDVVSAGSVDGSVVGLRFDQPVDQASAETAANYLINGVPAVTARLRIFDPLNPMQQLRTNATEVLLTPASPVSGTFTVVVSSVTSASGTPLAGNDTAIGSSLGLTSLDVDPRAISFSRPEISGAQTSTLPGESHSFAPGQMELVSGGHDIFGNFDGFRFVYKQITGDFDLKVRIPYIDLVRTPTKGGFDARISLDPSSPHVGAYANPQLPGRNFFEAGARTNYNQTTISWGNQTVATYPNAWLRFRRAGNTFMRYSSTNGVNWLFDGQFSPSTPNSQGMQFPATLYVGFAGNCNVGGGTIQQHAVAQFDSYGDFAGYPGSVITITAQPVNTTVAAGSSVNITGLAATLTGGGAPSSAGELVYVWQRFDGTGWTNLPTAGATNNIFATGALGGNDNGAQYRAIVQAPGAASVTSATATVTVTDAAPPTVATVLVPTNSPNQIHIRFSENVTDSALNTANYTLTNQITGTVYSFSSAAFLAGDRRTLILTATVPFESSPRYALGISGIVDLGGVSIVSTAPVFNVNGQSGTFNPVVIDYYGSLATAANLSDLTNNVKFQNDSPDWMMLSNTFNLNGGNPGFPTSTPMLGDNYGVRMRSYFVPPTNGQYVFWWRADDFARFFMNTNATDSTNPLGRVGSFTMGVNNPLYNPTNSFVTPTLTAGQPYYTEFLFKEGGGGDGGCLMVTMGGSTNVVPSTNQFSPGYLWRYPDAVVRKPKMIVDFFTGLANVGQAGQSASGNLPDLLWVTNFQAVVAGLVNGTGYERISGYGTNLGNTSLDNYLGRIYGYFVPPTNGNYRFYTRSDDASSFFMNTNALNSDDPAGKVHLRSQFAFTNITQYWQAPATVSLVGGQRYYIEGIWREGGGGDGMTMAVRGGGEAAPTGGLDLIPDNMLVFPTNLDRSGPINFNQAGSVGGIAPANPTVVEGQTLTFQARGVAGALPYLGAVWAKNGVQQLIGSTFWVTQPFTMADNGVAITLTVSNNFSIATATTIVTVVADNTSPSILSAVGSQYGNGVVVTFDEAVDTLSAETVGNYSIPGLTIYSAEREDWDARKVYLRTSPHVPGTVYTVSVSGVKDRSASGNPMALATENFTAWGFGGLGTVYVEVFTNIANTSPDFFFFDPKGVYNMPDHAYYTNVFGVGNFAAHSGLEFWAARVSGLFMPPSNGLYQFYVRGDDGTRLYMNTNGPDANGRTMIGRNDGANSATIGSTSGYLTGLANGNVGNSASPIISLTNGTPYYMEAIMKEGGGGDYLTVVMRSIDPATGQPYVALPLTPAAADVLGAGSFQATGNPDINQLLVSSAPPTELTVFENELVTLELVATAIPVSLTPYITYQWQRTNEGSGTFTNMPGATTPLLSFYATLPDDNTHYRLRASIPGQTLFFQTLLHVQTDVTPPYLVSASAREPVNGKQMVGIEFDGPVNVGIATEPSSYYAIDEFATAVLFSSAQFRPGFPNKLLLITEEGPLLGNITVYCDNMSDTAAIPNEGTGLFATGAVQRLAEQIVGTHQLFAAGGYNTNAPGLGFAGLATPTEMYTDTNGGWDVSANGWDIWNTADGMLFAHREVTGNFDIKTRVKKLTGADQWSKAGLMARTSTNATAANVFMQTTPRTSPIAGQAANNLFGFQWRDVEGAASASLNGSSANPPDYPNAWLRLQRSNSVFYGYRSTNGVDWALQAFRDTGSNIGGAFPDTLQVGLATVSHDQTRSLANNAYVEYRDLYFPNPAVITTQPTPDFVEIGIHQSVSFTGLVATGDGVRFQWRRNGVALTGETNSTLTLPDTAVGQSGIYTVAAFTDGGGQISSNCVLVVTNVLPVANSDSLVTTQGVSLVFPATDLTVNDTDFELDPVSVLAVFYPHYISTNFDAGLPSGLITSGAAHWTNGAGAAGVTSGALVLNPPYVGAIGVSGSAVLSEVTPGARILAFTASFNVRIADGTAEPADGMSFNFGSDLPTGVGNGVTNANMNGFAAENGVTPTGLAFCIDNYRFAPYPAGGTANSAGMKIRYANVDLAGVQTATAQPVWGGGSAFIPVTVSVDMAGNLNVIVNGTNVFGNRVIPWVPVAGRFGFYGRTGGAGEAHWIDDLNLSYIAEDTEKGGLITLTNGVIAYTPPSVACGPDTFYYLLSDGQVGGTNVGTVNVNVIGTNPPVLVSCVSDQTIAVGVGCTTGILPDLRGQLVVTDCGPLSVGQDPAPGSALAFGANVVTFSITNNAGFITNCTATITVADITPPVAVCPANITAEATGPGGAVVTFTPSGSDNCTLASVVAVPASGSTFPIGVTVVTVTATDGVGLTNACTFTVTVQDTTAPAINCPANIITACTSTNGAVVTYNVTSLDLVDPSPTLIVTPPSGSTFAQGTNLVTAVTYDSFGNTNTCSFFVIVQDQTAALLTITQSGTNVVVCWPQTCTPYVLEGTADLNTPITWTPVGLPVDVVGSDFCVTIPANDPKKFFRLRAP